jgi:DNA (cytosine-5)-methyltransferase 1
MKILNLYAGIGGNRLLWGNDHEITAVENVQAIADIYHDYFPKDTVIVADAHQYLLDHYKEFDFIWSSPPCPTHSRGRYAIALGTDHEKHPDKQLPVYPDMELYQEILFLRHYYKGLWVVENVISYYNPLIPPQEIAQHYFWSNFLIRPKTSKSRGHYDSVEKLMKRKGFDLTKYKGVDKRKLLRNCVEPETGLHILKLALNPIKTQGELL